MRNFGMRILLFATLCAALLVLSSCGLLDLDGECKHESVSETYAGMEVDPTCTEDGTQIIQTYCLKCGEVLSNRTETVPAYGHSEYCASYNYIQPTCTEGGYDERVFMCSNCNVTLRTEKEYVNDPGGHTFGYDYEKDGVAATCTKGGYYYLVSVCNVCDKEYEKELISTDPLGHEAGEEQVFDLIAAGCTSGGSYTSVYECKRCEMELSRKHVEVDPLGHDIKNNNAKNPTCLGVGWDAYESCTRCSYTTYDEIAALGHDEVLHSGLDANCENYGYEAYVTCTRCDYTTYKEILPLGHDYVNDVCTRCYLPKPTETLKFTLNSGKDSYTVSGVLSDEPSIVIPPVYNGLPVTHIGTSAFRGCTSLVSVALPRTLTCIGSSAFSGCVSLSEIILPDSLTVIESYAFMNCSSLLAMEIPSSVTKIEAFSFSGCSGITEIVVPDGVTGIGASAFAGCSSLESISLPFIGASKTESKNTHFGYIFGAKSYSDNSGNVPSTLTSVVINGGAVAANAFYNCWDLTDITLAEGVAGIGASSFYGCIGLKSITIHDGVQSIGGSAFYGCNSITEIVIPESVSSIGASAFEGCSSLASITLPFIGESRDATSNTYLGYIFGATSYLNNGKSIPKSLTSITLVDCDRIPDYAFYECSAFSEMIIPETVTSIGTYAFCRCTGLKEIAVPDSVTAILSSAFYGCSSLESITLPFIGGEAANGTKYGIFGFIFGATGLTENGSYVPLSLKSVVILGGTNVASHAFYGCSSIREMVLPDGVTSIGNYAFYGCTSLESLAIPSGVTAINESAFYNCTALSSLELPFGVASIGKSAFYGCSGLKSINIPTSVTEIGASAFYGCSAIEEIVIPEGISRILENTFYGCSSVAEITVPESVTYIGKAAFGGCDSLVSITLPFVGEYAGSSYPEDNHFGYIFGYTNGNSTDYDYSHLSNYYKYSIPVSLKNVTVTGGEVSNSVFRNCKSLVSVVLPEGLISIGWSAFYGCSSLTDVSIPKSVTNIFGEAFKGCTSLEKIHIESIEAWCGITLPSTVGTASPLYYGNLYLNGEKLTRIIIPSGVTEIKRYSFYYCTAEEIIIPDTVTSIGEYAFYGCAKLTSLVIPDSVDSIGISALEECRGLQSVTLPFIGAEREVYTNSHFRYLFGATAYDSSTNALPKNLKTVIITGGSTVPSYSFYKCDTLTTVVLPDSVTHIGARAFYGCGALTGLVIPSGVTGIDTYAFTDCVGLTEITIPSSIVGIGNDAFRGCSSLKEVTNWSSLQLIAGTTANGYVAYYADRVYTRSDESVTVGDYVFKSDESGNTLMEYIGDATEITLPEDYNGESYAIGDYAFRYSSLTSVTVPAGVTKIGSYAFPECLSEVILSEGVTTFGQYAFSGCAISTLDVPNSVKVIGSSAFEDCDSLVSVAFGENSALKIVQSRTFYGCSSLASVLLPSDIYLIQESAFAYCTSLGTIKIPDSVMFIKERAFQCCTNLSNITFGADSNLVELGQCVFSSCIKLTSIRLPDSIDRAWSAFADSYIREVALPLSMQLYHIGELFGGVSYSEEPTVYHRKAQSSSGGYLYYIYDIPSLLKVYLRGGDVGEGLFRNCDTLATVTFEEGAYKVGDYAFFGCTSLWSVGGMEYVTDIGDYAFSGCTSLSAVALGQHPDETVGWSMKIGSYAFAGCESLVSVVIGSCVSEISYYAFSECTVLSSVEFETTYGWYLRKTLENGSSYYSKIDSEHLASEATAARYLGSTYSTYRFVR